MPKKNPQGKSLKEIEEISQRLYAGSSNPNTKKADDPDRGVVATKEQMEEIVNRLFMKDPQEKKKELAEKAHQAADKDRPDSLGFQTKDKDAVEEITKRLFIADYVNRNVKSVSKPGSENRPTADEVEAITNRLFIQNYANKNILANDAFYGTILSKKKAEEKVLNKEELDETSARLTKAARDPAECNKELRGKQTFTSKGIYGTYAMASPEVCLTLQ